MSKEKQCECCHEWWYTSDIKEDLCPNCYNYFKQLKQQLEEIKDECDLYKKFAGGGAIDLVIEATGRTREVEKLKQQLAEEHKEIELYYDFLCNIADLIKTDVETLLFTNGNIITQKQTQLAIQELEKTLNFIENVFAIALKNCSLNNGYYDQILDFIDQQIKELKGEKDE